MLAEVIGMILMAQQGVKGYEFSQLEVLWLKKSLELQKNALIRSRAKEVVGSEIYALRTREIEALQSLSNRFV